MASPGPPPPVGGVGGVAPPPPVAGGMGASPPPPIVPGVMPPPVISAGSGGYGMPPPLVSPGSMEGRPPPVPLQPYTVSGVSSPAPIPEATGAPVLIGFLVTFQNEPTGKFWPLRSGRTTVGRSGVESAADIALPDASASARHATVIGDPTTGQAFVEDAGSRNGTYVNEQKLASGAQRQLHDNDRLRLGSITLVVKLLASG